MICSPGQSSDIGHDFGAVPRANNSQRRQAVHTTTVTSGRPSAAAATWVMALAMTPSAALAAVIGDKPMPRTEVTKKVWEYIKKNSLQDSAKKTMINADAKLKEIFKKGQVSMFEMTKLISGHLK